MKTIKNLNVFISSTFKDLVDERNQLMIVFHEAEKYAAKNSINLKEFDFRWGLHKESSVLKACLESINKSRPFFLCILGGAYGSQPKQEDYEKEKDGFLEQYNEFIETEVFKEKPENNLSYTAMEVRFVLNERFDKKSVRFFQLKYKKYIEEKQQELIDDIKKHGYTPVECESQKELMDGIRSFLMSIIDAASINKDIYEEDTQKFLFGGFNGWNSQSRQLYLYRTIQESTLNVLSLNSYPREQETLLNSFLVNSSNVCCIVGDDGVGKSTYLAQWIESNINRDVSKIKIIYHFFQEQYIDDIFEHLYLEVADLNNCSIEEYYANLFGNSRHVPKAITIFNEAIRQYESDAKLVIIIDGLEHSIIDFTNFIDFFANINKNIKLILTTGVVSFDSSKVDIISLPSLEKEEMEGMASSYFLQHHKSEKESIRIADGLAKNQMLHNPNLLMSILFDIRVFANFDNINSILNAYVNTSNPHEVYGIIINNWKRKLQVLRDSDVLAWIAYSHCGLSEEDIKNIAKIQDENDWYILKCIIQPYVIWNGDRLQFKNRILKETIIKNNITLENNIKNSMISYFKDNNMSIEKQFDELPYLYKNTQKHEQLLSYLLDLSVFKYANEHNNKRLDFIHYWTSFEISDYMKYLNSSHRYLCKKDYVLFLVELADFFFFHGIEMFPFIEFKKHEKESIHAMICEVALKELDKQTEEELEANQIAYIYRAVAVSYIESSKRKEARDLLTKAITILSSKVKQKWEFYEFSLLTQSIPELINDEDKLSAPLIQSIMRSSLLDALNPYIAILGEMLNTGLDAKTGKQYYDEVMDWIEKLDELQDNGYNISLLKSNIEYAYGMCLYEAEDYCAAFYKFNNSFELKFDYLIKQEKNQYQDPYQEYRLMETYKMIESCQVIEGDSELYSNQKRYVEAVEKYGLKHLDSSHYCNCIYNYAADLYNQYIEKEDSNLTYLLQEALRYYEKVVSYTKYDQQHSMFIKASFFKMMCFARMNQDEEIPRICKSILEREYKLTKYEKQDIQMRQILKICHSIEA